MIFIGYYTRCTPYQIVMSKKLLPSLIKWDLEYDIEGIDDRGNWYANTSYKARFILNMLNKHKKDVCFLDADATIEKYPELLFRIPEKYDFACHFLDWYLHWRNQRGQATRELLSGTMVFRYNPKVLSLMERYIEECENNPGVWEQKILQGILAKDKTVKIMNLPASYCAVIKFDNKVPEYVGEPVIVHHQASRKYKRNKS